MERQKGYIIGGMVAMILSIYLMTQWFTPEERKEPSGLQKLVDSRVGSEEKKAIASLIVISKKFIKQNDRVPAGGEELSTYIQKTDSLSLDLTQFKNIRYKEYPNGSIKIFFFLKLMPELEYVILIRKKPIKFW